MPFFLNLIVVIRAFELKKSYLLFQIMEITAAKDIIFALASSGVCVAYARGVKGYSIHFSAAVNRHENLLRSIRF